MKHQLLFASLLVASTSAFAADAPSVAASPRIAAPEISTEAFPLRRFGIDLADLVFVLFIGQTSEQLLPLDINAIPIRFNDEDNAHAFDYLLDQP